VNIEQYDVLAFSHNVAIALSVCCITSSQSICKQSSMIKWHKYSTTDCYRYRYRYR